jgi:polyisoprenoid-binding protein YceI
MKTTVHILTAFLSLATVVLAGPQTFDFKDPKGVNNAVFKLDATLESINGSANGISGTVTFDPENPAATKGRIVVSTASLHVPNPMMKEHLHSALWLDVAKYPEIVFETVALKNVKTTGDTTTADVAGKFTVKGITQTITAPAKLTYLKDKLGQRVPNQKGDLIVIRATFAIKRTDYGINPTAPQDKVADEINLTLSIAGAAPRP